MAKGKQKKGFRIRFELSIPGLFGVGVVCFCIFLWMFLFGVWAGQTILPSASPRDAWKGRGDVSKLVKGGKPEAAARDDVVLIEDNAKWKVEENEPPGWDAEPDSSEASVFSLQIDSFQDEKKASQAVLSWRAKGYEAFSLPAEDGKKGFQLFVGKYNELSAANVDAGKIESREKMRVYITLLPASRLDKASSENKKNVPSQKEQASGRGGKR